MQTIFFNALFIGLMCGAIAAVYRGVLAYEEPFSTWWRFGARFENTWLFKPLWGCAKCFAGQLGLWVYLFQAIRSERCPGAVGIMPFLDVSYHFQGYSILGHLFAIAVAIITAIIVDYKILKNV